MWDDGVPAYASICVQEALGDVEDTQMSVQEGFRQDYQLTISIIGKHTVIQLGRPLCMHYWISNNNPNNVKQVLLSYKVIQEVTVTECE